MAIAVAIESPLQDDVRELISQLNEHLLPTSPPEFQFTMTVEEMAAADMTVFIARDADGKAVGCGALKVHPGGIGEVKRMFTLPVVRGQRVGSVLLDAITALGCARGLSRLVLETGVGPEFSGAYRLYENSGFRRCSEVLDYPVSEHSAFYAKHLSPELVD